MKKKTVVICLFVGCLFVGIVVSALIRGGLHGENNEQPKNWSGKKLTKGEKAEVIKIAFDDTRVKKMLKGKEYKIEGEPFVMSGVSSEKGKKVLWAYPTVKIYIGEDDWMRIKAIYPLVDLDKKKVTQIRGYPLKPIMPREVTKEEKKKAIKIALANESVKEKIEGLEYEVRDVIAFKKWMTGEKLETVYVDIHIKGTGICYTAKVNLTEGRVTRISESYCGDKIGEEKSRKASKIAQNDPRIKERIEGKIKERDYEVIRRNRLIGKKLVVDVCIEIKEPPERYVATVDTEEWKVIGVWKAVPGTFFEKGEEIK